MNRRYRRRWWHRLRWLAVFALLVALRLVFAPPREVGPAVLPEGVYRVLRVVDGDTLLIEGNARVRLQGIDTPELGGDPDHGAFWGIAAKRFTSAFVEEAAHQVLLHFGPERIDRYGRFLAFVWRDDRLLNEELVRAGLATARLEYRYSGRLKKRFRSAQLAAQQEGLGIWSARMDGAP